MHRPATVLTAPVGGLRRYRGDHGAHAHAHAQVLFGHSGGLEVEVDGRLHWVDATRGLVVPAGARHASNAPRAAALWVVDTPEAPGLARARAFALPPGGIGEQPDPLALLALAGGAPRALPARRLDLDALARQVDASLHAPWSVARMAACCALSPPQFHARFKALTGDTPLGWLRQRRLAQATRLRATGLGLEAAALQVGYASASALCAALRRQAGG